MENNQEGEIDWEIKCFNCKTRTRHHTMMKNRFKCSRCSQYNKPKGRTLIKTDLFSKKEVEKDEYN